MIEQLVSPPEDNTCLCCGRTIAESDTFCRLCLLSGDAAVSRGDEDRTTEEPQEDAEPRT